MNFGDYAKSSAIIDLQLTRILSSFLELFDRWREDYDEDESPEILTPESFFDLLIGLHIIEFLAYLT
jgi:hypothetical protein